MGFQDGKNEVRKKEWKNEVREREWVSEWQTNSELKKYRLVS